MKIVFYGAREYDHYYFDVLAADPEYGCEIRFLTANLDADTAPLAQGGDAVCAFVNADCSAPVLEKLAQVGIRCLLLRCAGYNNVDLAAAKKCGITVLRVPGYSPEAVAEHAMALAQAANRRICKAYIKVRNNNFALDGLLGYNLYGSSAGIVGTGRIGAAMARICHGFGMTVLAYDQYRNPALDGIVRYVELDELLRSRRGRVVRFIFHNQLSISIVLQVVPPVQTLLSVCRLSRRNEGYFRFRKIHKW